MARKEISLNDNDEKNRERILEDIRDTVIYIYDILANSEEEDSKDKEEDKEEKEPFTIEKIIEKIESFFSSDKNDYMFKGLDNAIDKLIREITELPNKFESAFNKIKSACGCEEYSEEREVIKKGESTDNTRETTQKVNSPGENLNNSLQNKLESSPTPKEPLPDSEKVVGDLSNLPKSSTSDSNGIDQLKTQIDSLSKSNGGQTAATGEGTGEGAEAVAVETAETAVEVLPVLAAGGVTTEKAFTVGEGDAHNPNPNTTELIKNPTGAPIEVIPAPQVQQMGILPNTSGFAEKTDKSNKDVEHSLPELNYNSIPHYAEGTKDLPAFSQPNTDIATNSTNIVNNYNEVQHYVEGTKHSDKDITSSATTINNTYNNISHYAYGTSISSPETEISKKFQWDKMEHFARGTKPGETKAGIIGANISSGGEFTDPHYLVHEESETLQSIIKLIPVVGDKINKLIQKIEYLIQTTISVVEGFNKLAEKVSIYSADIMTAKAEVQVKEIQKDIETAQDIGPELAKLYKDSNLIWIDIQKRIRSLSEPFLQILVPVVSSIKNSIEASTPYFRAIMDLVTMLTIVIMHPWDWLKGKQDIKDMLEAKWQELLRHLRGDQNKIPFMDELMNSARIASRLGTIRGNIVTQGIP